MGYVKGDRVEYWSATHADWLPANVTAADPSGKIVLDVKPNAWLTLERQAEKVRPRKDDVSAAPSATPPVGPSSAMPQKASVVSNGLVPKSGGAGPEPSPSMHGRSPAIAGRQVIGT